MPDALVELETMHSERHARGIEGLFRAGLTVGGWRPRYLVGDKLSQIRVPTVVLWAARDAFMPVDEGRKTAERIPGARFEIIPDAGHLPCTDQPDATGLAIERALAAVGPER